MMEAIGFLKPMSPSRSLLINGFIIGYLALILAFWIIGKEDWPFCIYPMFAGVDRRGDFERIEYFTVSPEGEKWIDLRNPRNPSIMHWGFVLSAVLAKKGWPSNDTKNFLEIALDDLRRQSLREHPAQAPPYALKAYEVSYHFPESGDYEPIVVRKVPLLQVNEGQP